MIEHQAEEAKVSWDPQRAYDSFVEQFTLELVVNQTRAAIRDMPDSEMVKKGVKVKGPESEVVRVSIEEYLTQLELEREQVKLDLRRAGGITAVEAYFYGRQGISYAGEIPTPHAKTPPLTGKPGTTRL